MSSVNNSPEMISGPLYVTSETSKPKICEDNSGKPVTGSAYIQGPLEVGIDKDYSSVNATVMIGRMKNNQAKTPDRSLFVKGDVKIEGDGKTSNALLVQGDEQIVSGDLKNSNLKNCTGQNCRWTSSRINRQSWKGFDIQHPSREGYRLRYVCLEGPEGGVYIRGRVRNQTEIDLPEYWKDLVDIESITISLTPVGSHQDVIVKRWDQDKVYLQSKGGMPIDCFYHIFAERNDGEPLIVEYQGEGPEDYPGDSSQYSIAGYDYGRKK